MKNKNLTSHEELKDIHFGKKGTEKRELYEAGYQGFKIGILIKEARKEKGLTQEELAEKVGLTKTYISKIENDVKETSLSTLQKIARALGAHLNIKLEF